MVHPAALKQLDAREAITDAIYHSALASNTNDRGLYKSASVENDAILGKNGAHIYEGLEAVIENVFEPVAKLETQHWISNIRIELHDGVRRAHMVSYMLAQRHQPGKAMNLTKKGLVGGTANDVDLVLEDKDRL